MIDYRRITHSLVWFSFSHHFHFNIIFFFYLFTKSTRVWFSLWQVDVSPMYWFIALIYIMKLYFTTYRSITSNTNNEKLGKYYLTPCEWVLCVKNNRISISLLTRCCAYVLIDGIKSIYWNVTINAQMQKK